MNSIEQNLANWKASLFQSIPVAGLMARSPVAYKWKAPHRSWMLREAVFWRLHDLMSQSYALYTQGHMLGARILLRSGFETVAMLIYLNHLTNQVLEGNLRFHDFGDKTSRLLLGSRNKTTSQTAINIITIFEKCENCYPSLMGVYEILSESAHPNHEGLCGGYSWVDQANHQTYFENRWVKLYGDRHLSAMELCMEIFHHEYHDVWPHLLEQFEGWIEANDASLEATKSDTAQV